MIITITIYHELTHAGHYAIIKGSWYNGFVNAELAEIISNVGGQFSPYGNGTSSNSAIIALGESWAYHMGHVMADIKYGGNNSQTQHEQSGENFNNHSTTTGNVRRII